MAADSEVKLILTAKDDLTKTLGQVEEVINNLVKSQDKLADSSSDAQKSMGDLRAELSKLEAVRKSLLDQQGQLDKYKAETQASEQLAKKLEDQRLELEKLNAAKAAAQTNLDNQKAEVAASVKAVEAATEEAAAINRLSASRKALKKEAADQTRILREMSAALKENANATEQDKQAVLNQKAAVAAANDALAKQKATLGSLQAAQAERKKQLADQIAKEKELRGVLAEQERSARLQQAATADTNKALERKAASVERVTAALKGYGIETTDLVSAQNRLVEVATKVRTGLDAVGNEITNFDTGAKAARQAASRLAEDATKAADRLGKATIDGAFTGAAVPIQKVSAAIREILDPATKAERSIEALGNSVDEYADSIKKIGASNDSAEDKINGLRAAITGLKRAQDAALGQSKLIDKYQDQAGAVARLGTALKNAEDKVRGLSQQILASSGPTEALNSELRDSKRELESVSAAYRQAAGTLQGYKERLAGVGVSVDNLAEAQKRLALAATGSVGGIRQATTSLASMETANKKTAKSFELIPSSGRQALDLFQRMRGQILATVGAYVGLFAAIDNVNKSIEVTRKIAAVNSRLGLITGDNAAETAKLYGQLRAEAERLGLSFETLSTQYSKLAIAGKASGFAQEQVNFIFSSFTEAATKLRLDGQQVEGVFYAIEQIISKGTVNTEELRQQLGERLPGAFSTFAAALKEPNESLQDATQRVTKLLETGQITSQSLIPLAAKLRASYANSDEDLQTLDRQIERFKNAVFDLRAAFANKELQDRLGALIKKLTEVFKTQQFQEGIASLRKGFFALADGVVWAASSLDRMKLILGGLLSVGFLRYLSSTVIGFYNMAAAASAATAATTGLSVALGVVSKAFALVGFYFIADAISQATIETRKFTIYLGGEFTAAFEAIKGMWKELPILARIAFHSVSEIILSSLALIAVGISETLLNPFRNLAELAGQDDMVAAIDRIKESIEGIGSGMAESATIGRQEAVKELQQLEKDFQNTLAEIGDNTVAAFIQIEKDAADRLKPAFEIPTGGLDQTGGDQTNGPIFRPPDGGKAADKAIKQAEDLRDKIAKIIADTERKIAEESATTLEDRLALIADDYSEIFKTISEALSKGVIDPAIAQEANLLVGKLTVIRQEKERQAFANEQLVEAEKKLNDLLAQRDAQINATNTRLLDGRLNEFEASIKLDEITGQYRDKLITAAEAARSLAEALGDTTKVAQLNTTIDGLKGSVNELGASFNKDIAEGGARAIGTLGEGIGKVLDGTGSLSDAFKNAGDVFRNFAADFLRQIAQMILKQAILNAIGGGAGGGVGGTIASAVSATVAHTGAIIGRPGGVRRNVHPSLFAGAPRYHSGGMPGLKAGEVPAILQKGEEVLAKGDPRNAANGGGGNSTQVKIVNTIDSGSVVSEGVNTTDGQRAIINVIRANKSSIKNLLA